MQIQTGYPPMIALVLFLFTVSLFVYFDVQNNQQTRQNNFNNIDNAKNCIELQTFYLKAIDFESNFNNNGFSVKVTAHEQVKAKELGCN